MDIQDEAETRLTGKKFKVNSIKLPGLSEDSGFTAYEFEFRAKRVILSRGAHPNAIRVRKLLKFFGTQIHKYLDS